MIRKTENDSGLSFFLGNASLSCVLKIHYGKLQLIHMGAPVLPEDADAMCCSTLFGWGNDVLYSQEDNGSSLDTMPLAWSETGTGDYRESPVEILVDGKWRMVVEEDENFLRHRIHAFPETEITALRVTVAETWGDPSARLFEIRVY